MPCGIIVKDAENQNAEITYENAGLLGANIGVKDISKVAVLNRLADEYGLDTISLGNCLGFLMEASERNLSDGKLPWGDFEGCKVVIEDLINNRGLGEIIFEGVQKDASPGMALAYGTSPIGAHHKDAWVIAWEVSSPHRFSYTREKAEKVIEHQRWRGGWFECATVCRLPWIELGFGLDWYPKYMQAVTGHEISNDEIFELGDRVYALMRAYWVRESEGWSRQMDCPPSRWFDEPYNEGDFKGSKLNRDGYDQLLSWYYEIRGWDERGIPRKETLVSLGLGNIASDVGENG
jgi:aldehyde:ferredoxin oxidoreductase